MINDKIKSAFSIVNTTLPLNGLIIQFWAPIVSTKTGKLLLSSSLQPFSFAILNRRIRAYRNGSFKYQYSINNNDKVKEGDVDVITSGGPLVNAFLNHFPEVVMDLKAHKAKGNTLVDCALKFELTCSIFLPVFYRTSSSCVGVVECSMRRSNGLLLVFNDLKHALKVYCCCHLIYLF